MWREARLAFTDSVAALNCSIVPAHPWIYGLGQQTANGAYLSPVNAVRYLAERLAGTGGNADVVIMMVTGQTQENFMTSLNNLVGIFPAPAFTQVKRLAQSAAALAIEKMQIPAKTAAALPASIPLSVPTSRAALSAAAISQAQKAAGTGAEQQRPGLHHRRDNNRLHRKTGAAGCGVYRSAFALVYGVCGAIAAR